MDEIGYLHIGSIVLLLGGTALLLTSGQAVTGLISFTLAAMVVYSFTERHKHENRTSPA